MYKDYKDLSMIIEYKDTLQVIIAYTLKNTLCMCVSQKLVEDSEKSDPP